jgi:2-methylisocitrate lyase-like PEP mutase family enzyme
MQQSLFTALQHEQPLVIVGAINAFTARLAERAGMRAIYLLSPIRDPYG